MSGKIFGSFARIPKKKKFDNDDMLDASNSSANEKDFSSANLNSRGRFSSHDNQLTSADKETRTSMYLSNRSFKSKENDTSSQSGPNSGNDHKSGSQVDKSSGSSGTMVKSSIIFHDFKRNDRKEVPEFEPVKKSDSLTSIEFTINDDPSTFVPLISQPLRQRLEINLPINEYNAARLQTTLGINSTSDRIEDLENTTASAEEQINTIHNKMEEVMIKSQILNQTAQVVSQKLTALNELADSLDKSQENTFIYSFGWIVWVLSVISQLLSYIYQGIRKQNLRSSNKPVVQEKEETKNS
ncbi:hypothetical protein TVAG_101130 [Trichomonas vaginalis G3]|uniref:Uncharacterized protein n=1 Tax=Trichomonas vaginalis (strain ATCC PRA-98 / G3) TaxID=412133 RepID=A2DJJ5_TRIV3|nr:hypothetical protein TVAGG3_1036100 [Trichomonas vaginalis G3]EAY19395.1 hypothetical protein TVAG_101130 [Trichomonas vaginalis G3]KAI5493211.1 hypothetical protein TVAGG3_1036100 [Trichomonas vaginalis G3]|eukprot:XP_001580381.1 hypothetical protein [Trichomonas vaginalis G3]